MFHLDQEVKCSNSFSPAIAMSHINLTAPRPKGRRNGRRQKDGTEGPANPEELIEALQQERVFSIFLPVTFV